MRAFELWIRRQGGEKGRTTLRKVCQVRTQKEGKALDCWLRDRVRVDIFPIDLQVRKVLEKYHLPDDPLRLARLSRSTGYNPRIIARAANSLGSELASWE